MLAYIMLKDGELEVIPVEVDLYTFKFITIRGKVLPRQLLMPKLHFYDINGARTAVFLLSKHDFDVFY